MIKAIVFSILEKIFCRCDICAAVMMKENARMHKDWHTETKTTLQ